MKDQYWSGLTARLKLESVDDVNATISLTASVGFWKGAANALTGDGFGAWQVRAAIRDVVQQAEHSFYARISPEDDKSTLNTAKRGDPS